ncbi:MAG TPA: AAA family ATPase [Dehalococcoidia bacterium]|nr:AAA family ATPase [Dehalococcoidia bacterium]
MLTHLSVKNYKSLKSLDLQLKPFMALVGPNNAGKTNLVDAFQFLRDFQALGSGAINERGGFEGLAWDGRSANKIEIALSGSLSTSKMSTKVSPKAVSFTYVLELEGMKTYHTVTHETFSVILDGKEMTLLRGGAREDDVRGQFRGSIVYDLEGHETGRISADSSAPSLPYFQNLQEYPLLADFLTAIRRWDFHSFEPHMMMRQNPVKKALRLEDQGDNIATVLHTLQTEYPLSFEDIQEKLRLAIPEIRRLVTPLTETGQTFIAVEETGLSVRVPAWAMSDGTLCFLAVLTALLSPDGPTLICVEEPENYIHPHLLAFLVELLESASTHSQVIITTHSPYLVEAVKDPRHLLIVEKSNGITRTSWASKKRGVKDALRTLGLGEFWYSGALGGVPR